MSSKEKITIYDIAREANTSICTVSKALTGKPKVSDKKRQEIIKTANRLGYKANKIAHSLARKTIKIEFFCLLTGLSSTHTWKRESAPNSNSFRTIISKVFSNTFLIPEVYRPTSEGSLIKC